MGQVNGKARGEMASKNRVGELLHDPTGATAGLDNVMQLLRIDAGFGAQYHALTSGHHIDESYHVVDQFGHAAATNVTDVKYIACEMFQQWLAFLLSRKP